jgi:EAL and modified HD-GYP domain-containing signal transduction protein
MDLFVARQPIFNRALTVVAYEMLYRSGPRTEFDGTDARTATAKVINAVFYSPEGSNVLGGRPAFVNFPESLLLDDIGLFLPRDTVIEVLESVKPSERVRASCERLRARNYCIALDDFVDADGEHPLIGLATYIKVDFRETDREQCSRLSARYGERTTLIAEKVETEEDFRWASEHGYSLFQGYFFAKPKISSVCEIAGFKLNYIEILRRNCSPELNLLELATFVEREPGLTYKILRLANSALFGGRRAATSVRQAMLRIGETETRKWLSLIVMLDLASDKPSEVMVSALFRARFCELLGSEAGLRPRAQDLFMLGLFSRLDTIFSRPLSDLLDDVRPPEDVRNTLLGSGSPESNLSRVWSLVTHYEAAKWEKLAPLLAGLGVGSERVRSAYVAAVAWADSTMQPF